MSTARNESGSHQGPVSKKVYNVINKLNDLLSDLSTHNDVPTLQDSIDGCAKDILSIINAHKNDVVKTESYLKNAIIDLTEVPYMQMEMQKIAYEVAMKAAIKNLENFLDSNSSL